MKIFCIFLLKYLHMSKKSSTFAVSNEKNCKVSRKYFTYSRLNLIHK